MGQNVTASDFRMRIIPVEYLAKAKEEYLRFCGTLNLNPFEKKTYIDNCMLDLPELPFKPASIIVIIAKMSMKSAVFHLGDKTVTDLFRAREISVDDYLNGLYAEKGYHLVNARTLPQKMLAVCSGLAKYGRNNLVYEKDWGSFIQLETYISDVPPEPGFIWGDIADMEQCATCGVCARLCPGQAILKDKFLLDMEHCHGWLDVAGKLPESAPRTIAPCCVCQRNCPNNSKWRQNAETVEFSGEETALLMVEHEAPENPFKLRPEDMVNLMRGWGYPVPLVDKVMKLGIWPWNLKDIPGKLKLMFEQTA
jgi:epoxyqueuosine reductase